jgi:polysaccharide pyruvyl transferase WcaK-like protein
MKKIITINEILSDNIGDQAIAAALLELCGKKETLHVDKVDFSFRTVKKIKKEKPTHLKKIIRIILPNILLQILFLIKHYKTSAEISSNNYDLALIGGGQLILGGGFFPCSLFLYTYFLKKTGTKIKIVSAGVGTSFNFLERYLIGKSLRRVDSVYLRDQRSIENLSVHFRKNSKFCPDIVYYLTKEKLCKKISLPSNVTLVCPVEYRVFKKYMKEVNSRDLTSSEYCGIWIRLIRERLRMSDKVFLSGTTKRDYQFACHLFELLKEEDRAKTSLREIQTYDDFTTLAGVSGTVLSGRMHALILCHILGLNIVPFVLSEKIESYSNDYLNKTPDEFKKSLEEISEEILT